MRVGLEAAQRKVVYRWNQTAATYRDDVGVPEYFEELVKEQPDHPALECGDTVLTYKQLNDAVTRMASFIRDTAGATLDEAYDKNDGQVFVALYLTRDLNMIVSILSVLKAGAAYVPLAPDSPESRNRMILEDAKPVLILTNEQFVAQLKTVANCPVISVEDAEKKTKNSSGENLQMPRDVMPTDLAYMIYTSGTTGVPKGCMMEHKNIMHLVKAQGYLLSGEVERTLLYANYVFDAAVSEFFVGLLNGGTVILAQEDVRKDPKLLGDFLIEKKIDWATIPPVLAQVMDEDKLSCLKKLFLAGESPPADLLQRASRITDTYNAIGPTECTVCCSAHKYEPGDKPNNVGKPLPNVTLYVLDESRTPLLPGVSGELYIGGAGVGRGYLNRAELQDERFVPNPFGFGKIYKTGDLVAWSEDGDILFQGRIDRQVKIRGYRIELGEIEAQLTGMDGCKQAVVIDIGTASGAKALVAYLVGNITPEDAKKQLTDKLPEYMIPSNFTVIEKIPLTINGKVDRDALPKPATVQRDDIVRATTELEAKICQIWAEVLSLNEVGLTDNFFHSGGDSILCLSVLYKIRKEGLADLRANHLYSAPTVKEFAKVVKREEENTSKARGLTPFQGQLSGSFPHLPIQDWYFDKLDLPLPNHFNQDFTLLLPQDHKYTLEDIMEASTLLAHHHDMLRCVFTGGQNVVCSGNTTPVEVMDRRDENLSKAAKDAMQSSLDIVNGPVWRVILHSGNKLWLLFHHLVIDVVSWRILSEDLHTILTGGTLCSKTCSYKQWVEFVQSHAEKHKKEHVPFWEKMLAANVEDKLKPVQSSHSLYKVTLDVEHTSKLLKDGHRAYNTEINDLLTAALSLAMSATTGSDVNLVNLEGIGRLSEDVDVSRTVGWFTILYPAQLSSKGDLCDIIVNTKELLRSIPDKGLSYGGLTQAGHLQDKLGRVVFNYLGQLGSTAKDWSILLDESGEDIGKGNHDPRFSVEINGAVNMATGELFFDIMSWLEPSTTGTFCRALKQAMIDLVDHAVSVEVPIKTPSDFMVPGLTVTSLRELDSQCQPYGGIERLYTATGLQEAMMAHALLHPDDDAYTVQMVFDFDGRFDASSYSGAWGAVMSCYPSLRCAFFWTGLTPIMAVVNNVNAPVVDIVDLRSTSLSLNDVLKVDRSIGFDLSKPGLLRIKAIQVEDEKWVISTSIHHAVVDGWSQPILQKEVSRAYESLTASGKCNMGENDVAFFAGHDYLSKVPEQTRMYWEGMRMGVAGDVSMILNTTYDEVGDAGVIDQPAATTLVVSTVVTGRLREVCRNNNITINAAVQFAWHKLLQLYSGESETVVGTTVSGRDLPIEGLDSSIGMFINTLPLHLYWKKNASSVEMLRQIQERIGEIGTHSQMSLREIVRIMGKRPFQTVSVFDSFAETVNRVGAEDKFKLRTVIEKLDLPLGLTAADSMGSLSFTLMHNISWLTKERALELLEQMARMLEHVSHHPESSHEEAGAAAMSGAERKMVLEEWNDTKKPSGMDITAHRMFERIVYAQPDAVAVIFKEQHVTYRELNARANRLARMIQSSVGSQLDSNRDSFIALFLERDVNMIVAILAVLKAGAAYVPIAPKNPAERTRIVLEDAMPVIVLTNQGSIDCIADLTDIPILAVESVNTNAPSDNLDEVSRSPSDLAYMIYTSGTTGKPKGCMIEHRNLVWYIDASKIFTQGNGIQKTLFFADYVFDASIMEIFCPLLTGGITVIASAEVRRNPLEIGDLIVKEGCDFSFLTPMVAQVVETEKLARLKKLSLGGEAVPQELVDRLVDHTELWNGIGPTECTVICHAHQFQKGDLSNNIGKPLVNSQSYVLNDQLLPVPIGAPGEWCIGGEGVSRGYLNRPDLNKDRFVDNPFHPGRRLYRTGDLVRWMPDGNLQYIGRIDTQVKIRGFRIELGEIEAALKEVDGVDQAIVVDVTQDGKKFLAAYIVGDASSDIAKEHLEKRLPDYMIPSTFNHIESVPLTISGKLDRRALPEPDRSDLQREMVLPESNEEKEMCDLWARVLGIAEVSINDNFFGLGGNSLQVAQLVALSNGRVTVENLHEQRTLKDLVAAISSATANIMVKRDGADELVPTELSAAQKRLYVIDRLGSEESATYNMPWLTEVDAGANISKLEATLKALVQRHHILRTVYRERTDGTPQQHIVSVDEFEIVHKSVSSSENVQVIISKDAMAPFSLEKDLPVRATMYSQGDRRFLLVNFHHIAFDGWSQDVLVEEWTTLYNGGSLEPLSVQYADYAVWEKEQMNTRPEGIGFWKEFLDGAEAVDLPADVLKSTASDVEGSEVRFTVDVKVAEGLRALAKDLRTTMYAVTLTAFYTLLARFSDQKDLTIASPTADRPTFETMKMIGFFVNMMALRAKYDDSWTIRDFVKYVRDSVVAKAMANSYVPFDVVVNQCLGSEHTQGTLPPQFQIQFTLNRFASSSTLEGLPLTIPKDTSVNYVPAKFDLVMTLEDDEKNISGEIAFRKNRFSVAFGDCLAKQYTYILEKFASAATMQLKSIQLTTAEERQMVVYDWNKTVRPYSKDLTIHQQFQQTAAAMPDAVALIYNDEQLTYKELNARANRLALMLRMIAGTEIDNDRDSFVALYLERDVNMVVAILAVLKAGAAYVPIAPDKATDRAAMILEDAAPVAVITNTRHLDTIQTLTDAPVLAVESIHQSLPSTDLNTVKRTPDDVAYMIFTSGTTGKPKGCMIEHHRVLHLAVSQGSLLDDFKRSLFYASYVFDASVSELFVGLLNNKTVILAGEDVRKDAFLLANYIAQHQVDWATIPPVMAQVMDDQSLAVLKKLFLAGESPPLDLLDRASRVTDVYNAIGPTECTVCCSAHRYQTGDMPNNIGKPIPNVTVYVLDSRLEPVPLGAVGELYIGGVGVGRGYFKRPDLNEEKFLRNPFTEGRMYRSGDKVRWMPDGDMQFLGRMDRQVKIRGFRIELGEIESAINALKGVEQAVVIDVLQGRNKVLAAYIVGSLSVDDVALQLSSRLPEYMVPATFTAIEAVPMTVSGKLDRNALPVPVIAQNTDDVVRPESELEVKLCAIFAEVLNLDEVSTKDNFFHSGGDSIACLRVLYMIRTAGLAELSSKDFYAAPTVDSLARLIEWKKQDDNINVVKPYQGLVTGNFNTLPIQDFFFQKLNFPKPNHFNQAFTVVLPKDHGVTIAKLQDTVAKLANHHDMLRCLFKNQQHVCQDKVPVEVHHMGDSVADEKMLTNLQASLDIEAGPIWCVALHSGNKLWMAFHHLIIDVVSWRILSEDLRTIMSGKTLGPKTCSYKQWVEYVKSYAEKNCEAQVPFWKNRMASTSSTAFVAKTATAEIVEAKLGASYTSKLLTSAHRAYNTEINDLLLAALARALFVVSGEDRNSITLEGIGRVSDDVSLSRTVGWFTTMYPVSLVGAGDIEDVIVETKEILRSVPDKGLGYGALVQAGHIQDELPAVSFNYLGQLGSATTEDWAIAVDEVNGTDSAEENQVAQYTLQINGAVDKATGVLFLKIWSLLGAAITNNFRHALESELVNVVEHTSAVESPRKTPSDYAVPDLTLAWLRRIESAFLGQEIEAIYAATGLQQAFIAHAALYPDDDAYSVQMIMKCLVELDLASYQHAWEHVVRRFPALRCAFHWSGPAQVMVVMREVMLPAVEVIDLKGTGMTIENVRESDRRLGFDLSQPCPMRLKVIYTENGQTFILINAHHALLDGWSMPVLFEALNAAYLAHARTSKLPGLVEDKAFFAAHEYRKRSLPKAQEYWKSVHLGPANQLNFILNEAFRKAENTTVLDEPADEAVHLDSETTTLLKTMCRTHGVTLNAAVQFAWHKLLHLYTGDEETIVGSTISGRDMPVNGINSCVGLFINTLPIVLHWKSGASSLEMLKQTHEKVAEIGTYGQMPLSEIINNGSGETPFNTVSVFENYPESSEDVETFFEPQQTVEKLNMPLGLVAFERGGQLTLMLKYNMTWLANERANELLQQMSRLLGKVARDPEATHEDAAGAFMSEKERQMVVHDWNLTTRPCRDNITAHRLFEETVAEMPDNVALEYGDEKITYRDLNSRANCMALMIRKMVGPQLKSNRNCFVALYLDRDINMIVAILAVLKAGAAYVPIAVDNATERAQTILEDAEPVAVLTNKRYVEKLQVVTVAPIYAVENIDDGLPTENLFDVHRVAEDLAYMIYTSGTTGIPKGCMIEHRHLVYLGTAMGEILNGCKRSLLYAAYVFDASVWELFGGLLNKGTAILVSDEVRKDPVLLGKYVAQKQVDWATIPPVMAQVMDEKSLAVIKKLFLAGESPPVDLMDRASRLLDVYNAIGPTECTVCCCAHKYQTGDNPNNIGKPIANVKVYVLNEKLKPVPVGAPGELYIGGYLVGRGYLNRPELNEEKFLFNPFADGRLYKTGDAVRYLPNGDLQFLGRTDRQVKIRGFRIELGEVEAAIQGLDSVEQAVVIDIGQGKGKMLVAYFVGSVAPAHVASLLSERLPAYMIPSSFNSIKQIPMTISGKVDRRALPEPNVSISMVVPPRSPLEEILCEIFADTLGLDAVGITDNFFTSGGSSITAMDLVYRINNAGIANLRVKDIVGAPTVADIATLVGGKETETVFPLVELTRGRDASITSSTSSVRFSATDLNISTRGRDASITSSTSSVRFSATDLDISIRSSATSAHGAATDFVVARNNTRSSKRAWRNSTRSSIKASFFNNTRSSIRASRIIRDFRRLSMYGNQYVFLIHPGGSDAAVYQPIAETFYENGFNPKGIDNDVITSIKKHEMGRDLNQLGRFYADIIIPAMRRAGENSPIILLGWSLGGKIALEVAAILERRGKRNIFVYVMDTFLNASLLDLDLKTVVSKHMEGFFSTRRKSMVQRQPGLSELARRIAENEFMLSEQQLSGYLKYSKVTLFKAGSVAPGEDNIFKHAVEDFPDNGLRYCTKHFKVCILQDYHHSNIMEAEDDIMDVIVDDLSELEFLPARFEV